MKKKPSRFRLVQTTLIDNNLILSVVCPPRIGHLRAKIVGNGIKFFDVKMKPKGAK